MDEERIATALARIEAAAGRIEAASTRPRAGGGDPELSDRHERLKREAAAALAGLDQLIGTLEQ